MATHSSVLGWRILQTEEPGGLQSMGSVPVSFTSCEMIILTFFSVAGLGIISYFFMVQKYCTGYMYPIVYPSICNFIS